MAMATTTTDVSGIVPVDYGPLITTPVQRDSIAFQVSSLLRTMRNAVNFPVVADDPTAAWFAENADITASDATLDEITCTPSKVAGLVKISNELAADSDPDAAQIVGDGLARDIVAKIDAAYFANTTANGPSGLLSLTGVSEVDTGASVTNFDPFAAAISAAEQVGATVGAFVMKPATALALAQLKQATDSNLPLLAPDPADPARRSILGVPVLVSSAVDATTVAWAIPKAASYVVQRGGAEVEIDRSVYFASYSTAVRAVMRVGFAFPHEAAIVRLYDVA